MLGRNAASIVVRCSCLSLKAALTVTVSQLPGVDSALHFSISSADSLMCLSGLVRYLNLQATLASDTDTQGMFMLRKESSGKERKKQSARCKKALKLRAQKREFTG